MSDKTENTKEKPVSRYGDLNVEEFTQGEGLCRGGKPSGCWIWRYESGIIKEAGAFVDGKRDGIFFEFDEFGRKTTHRFYDAGLYPDHKKKPGTR